MSEFEEKSLVKKSGDSAEDINLVEVITKGGNPRGIPSAVFIVRPDRLLLSQTRSFHSCVILIDLI